MSNATAATATPYLTDAEAEAYFAETMAQIDAADRADRTYHYTSTYGATATKTEEGKTWFTSISYPATKFSAAEVVTKRHRAESGADARLKRFTPA